MPNTAGEALALRLLADGGVAALVGKSVHPSKPTENTPGDYVVYYKTGGRDGLNAAGPKRLQEYTYRVDCYGATDAAAQAILAAVVASLSTWVDRAGSGIQGCFPVADEDDATLDDARQIAGKTFRIFFQG